MGVGFIGLAHYLAKNDANYNDPEALHKVHELSEAFQYYLLKASSTLASEKGACSAFTETKYAKGLLPIDHYKKDLDQVVNPLN